MKNLTEKILLETKETYFKVRGIMSERMEFSLAVLNMKINLRIKQLITMTNC